MGLKDSFMGSSLLAKVCLIVLLVAQVCNYVSFTIPQWGKVYSIGNDFIGYGLWRMCPNTISISPCGSLDGIRVDWFSAVQALSVIGFLGINIAFFIVVMQMFTSRCKGVSDLTFWNALQCFVTATFYLVAVIIFGAMFEDYTSGSTDYGFCFVLAILALVLEVVAGILMLVDKKGTVVSAT